MGYQHFALAVSLPLTALTAEQFAAVLERLVGGGRRIDFRGASSESDADIVAAVVAVDDPSMPRLFECWSYAGLEELGPYPDLRFAVELWRGYGADSHCDFHPFAADGLDSRLRHRFLACERGQWWVATVDVPSLSGREDFRLVRPVELPAGTAAA